MTTEPLRIATEARVIEFRVLGTPRPQGSKKPVGRTKTGRVILVESSGVLLKDWRAAVTFAANAAMAGRERIAGPVLVSVWFSFARPKSHYGARGLRPSAPREHTQVPDLSKLARSLEDAMTDAGVWRDDSQVVRYGALEKHWGEWSGAIVRVEELAA